MRAAIHPRRWSGPEPAWRLLAPVVDLAVRLALRLRVEGLEHVPRRGPVLVVANHIGHLDPVVLLAVLWRRDRRARFLAVEGLWRVRVVGRLLTWGRMIPVRRGEGIEPMVADARAALAAGQAVVCYPEGTIARPGERLDARPGSGGLALAADVPIVPVALWGMQRGPGWYPPLRRRTAVVFGPPLEPVAGDPGDPAAAQAAADALLEAVRARLPRAVDLSRRRVSARRSRGG